MLKEQIFRNKDYDRERAEQLEKDLRNLKGLSSYQQLPLISTLLAKRGIYEIEAANRFLFPEWEACYDPYLLKDMDKAVSLIENAILAEDKIMIYGDYDVDGITSTSILFKSLSRLTSKLDYYIPDRIEEGYGINEEALKSIAENGAKLLISVDTGITAVTQVEAAKSFGLKVIITDHHECQEEIPNADAVVNPKQKDCRYPFDMLAGVGVTYKLIQALAKRFDFPKSFVEELVEIVAVGTIADIVPLVDENRIFVYQAFQRYKNPSNIGLQALFQVSQIHPEKISAGVIGFQIGPRLNAAGRLGDAKRGVQLFLANELEVALQIAEELDQENKNRREMEERIKNEADELIQNNLQLKDDKILVLAHEGWHHGVIGIVASRLTEKYYRPTVLLTIEDGIASGSARSVEGFSIFDALYENKELMIKFGGHEMAAGMSLKRENVPLLRDALQNYANTHMKEDTLVMKVNVDEELKLAEISTELIEELSLLEPYGMGNEEPRFLIQGRLSMVRAMGSEGQHVKLTIEENMKKLDIVAFHRKDLVEEMEEELEIQAVGTLQINEWKNSKNAQLMLKAVQYSQELQNCLGDLRNIFSEEEVEIEQLQSKKIIYQCMDKNLFHRDFFVNLYKTIKRLLKQDGLEMQVLKLDQLLENSFQGELRNKEGKLLMVALVLRVFSELKVFSYELQNQEVIQLKLGSAKKVELQQSKLYNNLMKS